MSVPEPLHDYIEDNLRQELHEGYPKARERYQGFVNCQQCDEYSFSVVICQVCKEKPSVPVKPTEET